MGCATSSSDDIEFDPTPRLPQDVSPYHGPVVEHIFIDVPVKLTARYSGVPGFSGLDLTTDVDEYYPLLSQQYANGFELVQFQMIPGTFSRRAFSRDMKLQFQGIFARKKKGDSNEQQLHVAKSTVARQLLQTGLKLMFSVDRDVVADTSHLTGQISDISAKGGRLICLEASMAKGKTVRQSMKGQAPVMGIDVLYHLPISSSSAVYTYQAVNIPITSVIKKRCTSVTVETNFDWTGQLQVYHSQGWKIVDIFFDKSFSKQGNGCTQTVTQNSIWLFEKEIGKLENVTPQYEGAVVEYWHQVSYGAFSGSAKGNWNDTIIEMGRRGWELSCIVSTYDIKLKTTSRTYYAKQLLIFERKI